MRVVRYSQCALLQKAVKGKKIEEMNAKKFFLMIGLGSLALGLLAGTVFGIFSPEKEKQQTHSQEETTENSPSNPIQRDQSPSPVDVKTPQQEETPVTETSRENTLDHGSENRRLTAEDAAQIAIEKTNGGVIKKVEYKRKDELFKVKVEKGDIKSKLEIDAHTGDILSIEIDD